MYFYNNGHLSEIQEHPKESIQIDMMADLHLDFHIRFNNEVGMKSSIKEFIRKEREKLKMESDEIVIVAGDISHYNDMSKEFLTQLSSTWKYVLVIPGNHDWYIQNKKEDRYNSLMESLEHKKNIIFLMDRTSIFNYKGIKIAGTTMFYNLDSMLDYAMWKSLLSDSRFMSRSFVQKRNKRDIAYYKEVINKVDVFVSHVPIVNLDGKAATRNLFLNVDVNPVKDVLYISGHTHNPTNSINEQLDIAAINVSYGYPSEICDSKSGIVSVCLKTP